MPFTQLQTINSEGGPMTAMTPTPLEVMRRQDTEQSIGQDSAGASSSSFIAKKLNRGSVNRDRKSRTSWTSMMSDDINDVRKAMKDKTKGQRDARGHQESLLCWMFGISRRDTANLYRLGIRSAIKGIDGGEKTFQTLMTSMSSRSKASICRLTTSGDLAMAGVDSEKADDEKEAWAEQMRDSAVPWSIFDLFETDLSADESDPYVIRACSHFAEISATLVATICVWTIWYTLLLATFWEILERDYREKEWRAREFQVVAQSVDYLCDAVFFLLTLTRPRTTVLDTLTASETCRPQTLVMRELQSKYFWLDLATCLPWTHAVRLGRAPHWIALVKIVRARHLLDQRSSSVILQNDLSLIVRILLYIFTAGHCLACIYFLITVKVPTYERHFYFQVVEAPYSFFEYYAIALRTCVYLVLGADIEGYSDLENFFVFFWTPAGVMVNALVLSQVIVVISRRSTLETQEVEERNKTRQAMQTLGLPSSLQLRIYAHYVFERVNKGHRTIDKLLGGLSEQLNFELHLARHYRLVMAVPFFRKSQPHILREIVQKLEDVIFLPGNFICRLGDEGQEMYFVHRGACSVMGEDMSAILRSVEKGDYFGEVSLLTGMQRTAHVRADTFCLVAELVKDEFDKIMRKEPQALQVIVGCFSDEQKAMLLEIRERRQMQAGLGGLATLGHEGVAGVGHRTSVSSMHHRPSYLTGIGALGHRDSSASYTSGGPFQASRMSRTGIGLGVDPRSASPQAHGALFAQFAGQGGPAAASIAARAKAKADAEVKEKKLEDLRWRRRSTVSIDSWTKRSDNKLPTQRERMSDDDIAERLDRIRPDPIGEQTDQTVQPENRDSKEETTEAKASVTSVTSLTSTPSVPPRPLPISTSDEAESHDMPDLPKSASFDGGDAVLSASGTPASQAAKQGKADVPQYSSNGEGSNSIQAGVDETIMTSETCRSFGQTNTGNSRGSNNSGRPWAESKSEGMFSNLKKWLGGSRQGGGLNRESGTSSNRLSAPDGMPTHSPRLSACSESAQGSIAASPCGSRPVSPSPFGGTLSETPSRQNSKRGVEPVQPTSPSSMRGGGARRPSLSIQTSAAALFGRGRTNPNLAEQIEASANSRGPSPPLLSAADEDEQQGQAAPAACPRRMSRLQRRPSLLHNVLSGFAGPSVPRRPSVGKGEGHVSEDGQGSEGVEEPKSPKTPGRPGGLPGLSGFFQRKKTNPNLDKSDEQNEEDGLRSSSSSPRPGSGPASPLPAVQDLEDDDDSESSKSDEQPEFKSSDQDSVNKFESEVEQELNPYSNGEFEDSSGRLAETVSEVHELNQKLQATVDRLRESWITNRSDIRDERRDMTVTLENLADQVADAHDQLVRMSAKQNDRENDLALQAMNYAGQALQEKENIAREKETNARKKGGRKRSKGPWDSEASSSERPHASVA